MTPCPVSIASDTTSATTSHAIPIPNRDLPAPMDWKPGQLTGTHSLASNVSHKGAPIVTEGHDLGPMILHLIHDLLVELKSSRKMAFVASTVLARAKPVACTQGLMPMVACADIGVPAGANDSNGTHSVLVGMSDFDIGLGWYDITTSMVVDGICFANGFKKMITPDEKGIYEPPDLEGTGGDAFGIDPLKMALGAPVSLGRSVLVSWHNDWTTPVGVKFGLGGGGASASKEVSFDPKTKTLVVKDSQNVPGLTGEDWYAVGPDGIKRGGRSTRTTGDKSEAKWGTPL